MVTTGLAGAIVAGMFWLIARKQSEEHWVRHTLAVRNQLANVLILVQRTETGQRGYLLTDRDVYLEPYNVAVGELTSAIDEAAKLVSDNPRQGKAVEELRPLIAQKLQELRTTIDERRAGRFDAALAIVDTDQGLRLMDAIRSNISSMQAEEDRLLADRQQRASTFGMLLQIGAASAFLLICVVGALVGYFTRRSFSELTAARDQLMITNEELLAQVNQREQVESQLRQAQKMEAVGQLTGGIAHDFNNMLGVIAGSLDLMQRRIKKGDFGVERFMEAAHQATSRAATLTHRLLAFARQQPLAPEPINANEMIAGMSDLLRSTLGEQIRIETVLAAGLWPTHADAHQLESAVLNIAINARDAMPDGGRLTIETGNAYLDDAYCQKNGEIEPGQFVLVAVSDTGDGHEAGHRGASVRSVLHHEAARQGHRARSEPSPRLRQAVARAYQNLFRDRRRHDGEDLSAAASWGTKSIARAVPTVAQMGNASEIILVVEDDPLMRQLSTDALRELGYSVLHSGNRADALDILDETPGVRLLFTDVVMPEVNGKKLADEALRRRPELKVLFTTGYTPNAVVHGGVLDRGVNFLSKPFTIEQLAAKVRAVLDG